MGSLKIIETQSEDFAERWGLLRAKLSLEGALWEDPDRLVAVRTIIAKVRAGGDEAVARLTREYDRIEVGPDDVRIPTTALQEAHAGLDKGLLAVLREAAANVRRYQEAIVVQGPADWTENGVRLGVRYRPLDRVGVCVPGASAPLVSTVIMTVVPARVAGVKEIAVMSSPSYQGSVHPAILGLCCELGVEEVYRMSGAQGVAAMAFGTERVGKVDKIVGPGSGWGQLAKKELYGVVDIDSFAGPSEVLILADGSARPDWVAADMLSQAEHDPGSAILVTESALLATDVAAQVDKQLARLGRAERTRKCIEAFSAAVVTRDGAEAVQIANDFAPEHLQILCADSEAVAEKIEHAGAIFIGPYTPVAVGDYWAGPSHTLPTGGSARFWGALNVNDFRKQSSVIAYDAGALARAQEAICALADVEGLDAHGRSITIRGED